MTYFSVRSATTPKIAAVADLIVFPEYVRIVVEERLREQEEAGVAMPAGLDRDELALRILVAAQLLRGRPGEQGAELAGPSGSPDALDADAPPEGTVD